MSAQTTQAPQDPGRQLIEWIVKNRRTVITVAVALAAAALVVWFVIEYQHRKELAAIRALEEARVALQSGNVPLAASDLSRLVSTYGGTVAGDEAVVLLAQVRLEQDQPTVAAEELRAALNRGVRPQFLASIHGLLGTALEAIGNQREAAEAYERASEATWYQYLKALYLNEAGRAFLAAQDTARSLAVYERVLSDHADTPGAAEARVRLAELRAVMGT